MPPTESTSLLPTLSSHSSPVDASQHVNTIFIVTQGILLVFFLFGTDYSSEEYKVKEYIAFRDISKSHAIVR